jgi:hypothetical protein
MLCDVCKSVDFVDLCFRASQPDQPSFDERGYVPIKLSHHTTFAGLKAAAENPSQYDSPKSAIHCSVSGIAFHKSSKPYAGQTYRGVSSLSFAAEEFPFWSTVRVFCEHGKEINFFHIFV